MPPSLPSLLPLESFFVQLKPSFLQQELSSSFSLFFCSHSNLFLSLLLLLPLLLSTLLKNSNTFITSKILSLKILTAVSLLCSRASGTYCTKYLLMYIFLNCCCMRLFLSSCCCLLYLVHHYHQSSELYLCLMHFHHCCLHHYHQNSERCCSDLHLI